MQTCPVCSAPSTESHFGAMVCRSCSAFFRRFVLSKKKKIICFHNNKCSIDYKFKTVCRFCRMAKCVAAGMMATRISYQIESKNMDKIKYLIQNQPRFLEERERMFANTTHRVNFADATTVFEANYRISKQHFERSFKELANLSKTNRECLFNQFYSRFIGAESVYYVVQSADYSYFHVINNTIRTLPVEKFYLGNHKNSKLNQNDIYSMFRPFWDRAINQVVLPLAELNLDSFEFSSIFGLILFDGTHIGIDEQCVEMCYQIRNIIYREITNYHKEKGIEEPALRMADIMKSLLLFENLREIVKTVLELSCLYKMDHNEQICQIYKR